MACQLICPNLRCRKILSVPDEVRGKLVKCQHCQTMFRVPELKRSGGGAAGAGVAASPTVSTVASGAEPAK